MRLIKRLKGVSYIEAVFVLPVFILLVIAVIDFAWYITTYVFFSYGAQVAVDWASKVQIETPTTVSACTDDETLCTEYEARVNKIITKALNIAKFIATDSATPSKVQLLPFVLYDATLYASGDNNSGIAPMSSDIGFMRPGEKIIRDPG
ncbi:MAG: TadE family protein, partial [bacterium]|nr:TadE family protein [bacterium]